LAVPENHTLEPKITNLSHAHTVVRECCEGDHQSQWERAKFDPQPTQNPLTDRYQIWITWLCPGSYRRKSGVNSFM